LPALAFGSHYSVFKERPGTHLFTGVDAGCPKDCSGQKLSPESLLRLPEGRGAVPTGVSHYQTRDRASTRPNRPNTVGSTRLSRLTASILPVIATQNRGPLHVRPRGGGTPSGGMRRTTLGPPHATPVFGAQLAFRPSPIAMVRLRGRALPVDFLDLPLVTNVRDRIITSGCCTIVTTP
jgi:hypothetical protein